MGCGHTEHIPDPVVVEVPGPVQWRPIAPELLTLHLPSDIPESASYGDAMQLWNADRESLKLMIANVRAISDLGKNLPDIEGEDSVE